MNEKRQLAYKMGWFTPQINALTRVVGREKTELLGVFRTTACSAAHCHGLRSGSETAPAGNRPPLSELPVT